MDYKQVLAPKHYELLSTEIIRWKNDNSTPLWLRFQTNQEAEKARENINNIFAINESDVLGNILIIDEEAPQIAAKLIHHL